MEVKPGYKMTEMGVIPEDWEVTRLGEASDVLTGFPFPSHEFSSLGVRLLRGSNVKRNAIDWDEAITKNWPAISSDLNKYELREGDIVIAMDGALVGRSFATVSKEDLPALLVQRVARLRSRKTEQKLIGSWINSDHFIRHVDLVKTHTAIPHISPKDIREFTLAVPSEGTEQRAIATALSDMDALLDGLDRLIAKKCAIKQATMQQLLTGQTRLPGFSGAWEIKRLGDLGATYGGLVGKNKADFGTGSAKYVPFINVIANVQIDCTAFDAVNVEAAENQNKVAKGDLLFNGSSETPEEVALCSFMAKEVKNLYLNSFCFGLRVKNPEMIDGLFLAYYIRSPIGRDLMKSLAQGSTRYNLSKRALLEAQLPLPEKEEQTAIATVLSDMDAEITVLETRRTKTRALKQAMTQELLTGRTRLV